MICLDQINLRETIFIIAGRKSSATDFEIDLEKNLISNVVPKRSRGVALIAIHNFSFERDITHAISDRNAGTINRCELKVKQIFRIHPGNIFRSSWRSLGIHR